MKYRIDGRGPVEGIDAQDAVENCSPPPFMGATIRLFDPSTGDFNKVGSVDYQGGIGQWNPIAVQH